MINKIKSFLKKCFFSKKTQDYGLQASVISIIPRNRFHGVNFQPDELTSISRQQARLENTQLSEIPEEEILTLSESKSISSFDVGTESIITNTDIMLETMQVSEIILDQKPSPIAQRPSCVPLLDLSKINNSEEEYSTARSKSPFFN